MQLFVYSAAPDANYTAAIVLLTLAVLNICIGLSVFLTVQFSGELVLLGDSNVVGIKKSSFSNQHALRNYIQSKPEVKGTVIEFGRPGTRITDIIKTYNSIPVQVNNYFAKGYVLFWDGDVANVKNATDPAIVAEYKKNVYYLARKILSSPCKLAIAGPTVIALHNSELQDGEDKGAQLDAYVEINRMIANDLKIPFVDVRRPLLESYRRGVDPTYEGDHMNDIGISIAGDLFVKVINSWKCHPVQRLGGGHRKGGGQRRGNNDPCSF